MVKQEMLDLIGQLPEETQRKVLELVLRAETAEQPEDLVRELEFLLGVQVSASSFGEWQDTEAAFLGSARRE
jgi:hypothetical protein